MNAASKCRQSRRLSTSRFRQPWDAWSLTAIFDHAKSAREVAKMGVPVFEYTPLQVKTAVTGYGKAKKPQVMEMTRRLLRLKETPKPDDTADALAIAITHTQSAGSGLRQYMMKRGI